MFSIDFIFYVWRKSTAINFDPKAVHKNTVIIQIATPRLNLFMVT